MGRSDRVQGMLSPYRVLDLTDESGVLCGKLLGDLGADVIKIERPGGDPARSRGPFLHDEIDPEKSLFWFAFNTSKRGITLNIETSDGQEIFKRLAKAADFVIESFPPGYMDKLSLGYSALERINPGIIIVSITPFGQTGPYRDYKAAGIVAWAMGGHMHPCGNPDSPPVEIGHHSQAYLHASVEAAAGALIALSYRQITGEGQHVDVSIQDSLAQSNYTLSSAWDMMKSVRRRGEQSERYAHVRRMWPCQDGYVMWFFFSGVVAKTRNPALVRWMDSEGMADDFLREFDWTTFDWRTTTQEIMDRLEAPTAKFFMSHTKAELLEGALKHRVILYPVSTTRDILESAQLAARGFFVELAHPELGITITYPGAFARCSSASPRILRRAPLVGEHNDEIFESELGLSKEELVTLKQAGII